ncbi:MAG: glycine--tRNA ligase subunit alpha [Myxococcota bacterium]
MVDKLTFQELILQLQQFWARQGCLLLQGADMEVGAGTLHRHTALRVLGPEPWCCVYVQPCRRPTDGRYGENPNRVQHYYQLQVILKPAPANPQQLYLDSLRAIGLNPAELDVRFVEDDWEHPALGACGLGWEVWAHGMEVTQFTYFQQFGGLQLQPVSCELTYGLERLACYQQNVPDMFALTWGRLPNGQTITYGQLHREEERQWSHHNFEQANVDMYRRHFADCEQQAQQLIKQDLVLPAYDYLLRCSHLFNVMDARAAVSVTERANYLARVRHLAKACCEGYLQHRQQLGFPLLSTTQNSNNREKDSAGRHPLPHTP